MKKKCWKCGEEKDCVLFHKNSSRVDGIHHTCKTCRKGTERIGESTCLYCHATFSPWRGAPGNFCSKRCGKLYNLSPQDGPSNPNWKGGVTPEINRFYNSPEWKALRRQAFERDNFTCRDCPQRGGRLEANHIKPRSRFPDLKLVLENIETLCKKCHDKKKWIVYL